MNKDILFHVSTASHIFMVCIGHICTLGIYVQLAYNEGSREGI